MRKGEIKRKGRLPIRTDWRVLWGREEREGEREKRETEK